MRPERPREITFYVDEQTATGLKKDSLLTIDSHVAAARLDRNNEGNSEMVLTLDKENVHQRRRTHWICRNIHP